MGFFPLFEDHPDMLRRFPACRAAMGRVGPKVPKPGWCLKHVVVGVISGYNP